MSCVVQLRLAPLPYIGAFASHYWFVVFDETSGECERWEVWQTPDAGGLSFGHLHCNLKTPDAGVGGGPSSVATQWRADDALRIRDALKSAEKDYPFRDRYLPWPGPNSNTFVAWVLRRAGIEFALSWKAIGKDFA
jgi:Protein of unknown function (DUF3750)